MYTIANNGSKVLFFGSYEIAPSFSRTISDQEYFDIASGFVGGVAPVITGVTITKHLDTAPNQAVVTDGQVLALDTGTATFDVTNGVLTGTYTP